MEIKEIQNLIKFVAKSGVTEVAIEQGDFKITIISDHASEQVVVQQAPLAMPQQNMAPQQQTQAAQTNQQTPAQQAQQEEESKAAENAEKLIEIKSPMIGTFYRRSSPDKDPFASVGDTIKPGDVLCIVEAMKLFNEIESEMAGKIVKVLVDDNSPIEYDQPLFLVDPA
ncbi:MAG: acetyl-CoA carboxylase biotin carboxyl carrier protein [Crocinitomicaceae bacterium]